MSGARCLLAPANILDANFIVLDEKVAILDNFNEVTIIESWVSCHVSRNNNSFLYLNLRCVIVLFGAKRPDDTTTLGVPALEGRLKRLISFALFNSLVDA